MMRKPKNLSLEPDAIERGQRYGRLHGKIDLLAARQRLSPRPTVGIRNQAGDLASGPAPARSRHRWRSGACAESPPVGGLAARNIGEHLAQKYGGNRLIGCREPGASRASPRGAYLGALVTRAVPAIPKLLIDTNVVLDVMLKKRGPWWKIRREVRSRRRSAARSGRPSAPPRWEATSRRTSASPTRRPSYSGR